MQTFEHQVTVRFREVDRAGIVYFARVFDYCHYAFEEMLGAIFGSVEAVFAAEDWGMPLVHAEADYARPLRLHERLTIALRVEKLSRRSVTFAYTVRGPGGADDVRATARLVHAFVDLKAFRGREVPDDLAAGLARLGLWEEQP